MKSTSIHNLNADRGLSKPMKLSYLCLNWVNNLLPYWQIDQRIVFKNFGGLPWEKEWDKTYQASSIGRRLSDLFWRTLPWDKIVDELGEIHVFDTGCGHGNYSIRLDDASGGCITSYTGVDAKRRENWSELEKQYPNFHFIESSSSDISSLIPSNTNLFITQSAIEHFDEDLPFFRQIRQYIEKSDKPVIQIHNFPARAILPLYLLHGVRQYTPRTVSKITRLFDGKTKFYLVGLGGKTSKKLHFKYFTWPILILRRKATWSNNVDVYDKAVRKAISDDSRHPIKNPLFWVMIIHSNFKNKIW